VRITDIPMPPAVATRPRDERGYPVLAITPWAGGAPKFAATTTVEAPGHRECMLYAAAVVGFAHMEFRYADVTMFRFAGVVEFLPHTDGADQLPALLAAISSAHTPADCPDYLGTDESLAEQRFAILRAASPGDSAA
jgi:hypothetical protein